MDKLSAFAGTLDILYMARPAAVGLEGDYGFTPPIIGFQTGQYCRSHRVPPCRRTDCNDLIICRIDGQRMNLWLITPIYFLLPLVNNILI